MSKDRRIVLPASCVNIDPAHPAARHIARVFVGGRFRTYSGVDTGASGIITTTLNTPRGIASTFNGASQYAASSSFPAPTDCTLLLVGSFGIAAGATDSIRQPIATSMNSSVVGSLNYSLTHVNGSFANAWGAHNGSWNPYQYSDNFAAGRIVSLAATAGANGFGAFFNGKRTHTDAAKTGVMNGTTPLYVGCGFGVAVHCPSNILLAAEFSAVLPDGLIQELSENPAGLFLAPNSRRILLGAAVSTGASNASPAILGVEATSAAGTLAVTTTTTVPIAGVASGVIAGLVSPVADTIAVATGVDVSALPGIVQIRVDATAVLPGQVVSTLPGTVSITTTGNVNVNLTGAAAQVQLGNVSVQADAPIGPLPSAFGGGGGGHKGWDREEHKRKRKFLDDLDATVEEAAAPPVTPITAPVKRIELDLSTLQAAITKPYIRPSVPAKPPADDDEEEFLLIHLLLD